MGIKSFLISILLIICQLVKAQAPVADFSGTPVSGCSPLVVSFNDLSTGDPKYWNWDLGNGQLSNLQNPIVSYNQPGTYSVTLVVRNANGIDAITRTDYITVNPSPAAGFTVNQTSGCAPSSFQFTDLSTTPSGSITGWDWDFGDGSTSNVQNPSHTYMLQGFYNVSLKVSSTTGCPASVTQFRYIRIVAGVVAEFTNSALNTCQPPFVVNYSNQTSGPGTLSYNWDLGNSATSTIANPSTTYNAMGNYTITLIAQSSFGCSDTVQRTIPFDGISTTFNAPDSVCINAAVNFQNTSAEIPVSSTWDFGDGTQSSLVNASKTYTASGTYAVKLVNKYSGCVDSVVKNITVLNKPTIDFTADKTGACKTPFVVNFQDLTPNASSWIWNFGDGGNSNQQNPAHQYNSVQPYDVALTVTDTHGCQNTLIKPSFITIIKPTVNIANAPFGGCIPFTYSPVADVNAIDGVASYFWDFGDGGFTSTLQNPTYTYTNPGRYTIKLRITTLGGCTDSIVFPNGIGAGTVPSVDFSAAPLSVCAHAPVNFTGISDSSDQWSWDFGDGGTSDSQFPTHNYSDTGLFNVTLTGINKGCSNTVIKNQYINVFPPVAKFSYTVNCGGGTVVSFINQSIVNPLNGSISYLWKFGDPANNTSTNTNPIVTYPGLGTYSVMLIVTNGSCSDTIIKQVSIVNETADFSINKNTVCRNELFTLTAINSIAQNVQSYQWTIGTAPPFTGDRSINYSIGNDGVYDVSLAITDINGCVKTKTATGYITVIGPTAKFGLADTTACRNDIISFSDSSSSPAGIVNWTWDFGDRTNQSFTAPPFNHQYSDTGIYSIKLQVRDASGCTDTFSLINAVTVYHPTAFFKNDTVLYCPGLPINFKDSSSGIKLTYFWDFGDGNTSLLQNPVHAYAGGDKDYTVKLKVRDSLGCEDSLVRVNYIHIKSPKAAFSISDSATICPPFETHFTLLGQDYDSFYWDFGDGSDISLAQNPRHFYNSFSTFSPKLYVTGFGGCIDSASKNIYVVDPATSVINYSPVNACNNLLVDFAITPAINTKFVFNFGDGLADTTQRTSFSHFYNSPAFYFPSLFLTDKTGCQVTVPGATPVRVIGAQPLFGKDKKDFCDSGTVFFTNYTIGNDNVIAYIWDFGDNTGTLDKDPFHNYSRPGTFIIKLTVNTQSGCTDSITDTMRVYGTPLATITSRDTICINTPLPFNGNLLRPDSSIQWNWTFDDGTSSGLRDPVKLYSNPGSYKVQLDTRIPYGCNSTTSKIIQVVPLPGINIAADPVIPSGTGIRIPVDYTGNIVTYTWTPDWNLNCTDCPNPFANPKSTTKYKVTVTDNYGCVSTKDITIFVICNGQNIFIPNTFSPDGNGMNDRFYPKGSGIIRVQSLRIFNRWGETVFEKKNFPANNSSAGWDGTYKGKKADSDVYVYSIEIICENEQIVPFKGNVMLLR